MTFLHFAKHVSSRLLSPAVKSPKNCISEKLMIFFLYLHFNSLLVLHLPLATREKYSLNWNNLKKRLPLTVLL